MTVTLQCEYLKNALKYTRNILCVNILSILKEYTGKNTIVYYSLYTTRVLWSILGVYYKNTIAIPLCVYIKTPLEYTGVVLKI